MSSDPLEATTPPMRRTAGIKNKIRTRVVRREKSSDSLTPYYESGFYYAHRHRHRRPATAAPSRETVLGRRAAAWGLSKPQRSDRTPHDSNA